MSGNATVVNVEEIHFKNKDVQSELACAKQEMDRAYAEYKRNLEHYNAMKRHIQIRQAVSHNGHFSVQKEDARQQQSLLTSKRKPAAAG